MIERPEPEVAVPQNVGDGGIAVVDAVEQGADSGELIHLGVMGGLVVGEKRCGPMPEVSMRRASRDHSKESS